MGKLKVPKQPGIHQGLTKAERFHRGSIRSQKRLNALKFDPIGELVKQYRELEKLVDFWTRIRDGVQVELTKKGRVKAYNARAHMDAYNALIAIGEKLLRYNYGRVPEVNEVQVTQPAPMFVQLSDNPKDIATINPPIPVEYHDEDDENEQSEEDM
jgi:hypothetical protein